MLLKAAIVILILVMVLSIGLHMIDLPNPAFAQSMESWDAAYQAMVKVINDMIREQIERMLMNRRVFHHWPTIKGTWRANKMGDFNGDGRTDLLFFVNQYGGARVLLSMPPNNIFSNPTVWTMAGNRGRGWYIGDFNGDSMDDLLRVLNQYGGAEVLLSDGAKFGSAVLWTQAGYRWGEGQADNGENRAGWYVGDFDGDGDDDLLRVLNQYGGAEVLLSDGAKFGPPIVWTQAGFRGMGWYVGDFDGDGDDDLLRVLNENGGAEVLLSDRTKFGPAAVWTGYTYGGMGWYVGDFNGDRKDDLLSLVNQSGGAYVHLSDGVKFGSPIGWTVAGFHGQGWFVGDFTGDDRDDLLRYQPQAGTALEVLYSTGTMFGNVLPRGGVSWENSLVCC